MSSKLRVYGAALLLLGACQGDPKKPKLAPPSKSPHGESLATKPQALPADLSTEDAAKKVLNDLMADENPGVKVVAVRAWSGLTGAASDAALQKALYDSDPLVHTIAAAALARRGDLSGLPLLAEALGGKEISGASGIVITALRHMNPKDALPTLESCLATASASLLASCASAMAHLGDKRGDDILKAMLKSPPTAAELAKNLRFLPEPLSLSLLSDLFEQDDNYKEAKTLAIVSMTSYGEGVLPALRTALSSPDTLLKGVAAALLLARGQDADPNLVAAAIQEPQGPALFSIIGKRLKKPDPRILPAVNLVLRGPTPGFPFAFQVLQSLIEDGAKLSDTSALYALLDAVPNLTGHAKPTTPAPASAPASTSAPSSQASSAPTKLSLADAQKLRAAQGAAILAAAYLAALGDPRGFDTMSKLLDWPNAAPAWIPAISALQGEAAFPLVLLAAKHEAAEVRAASLLVLAKAAKGGNKEALATVSKLGKDVSPEVKQALLTNLSLFSEAEANTIARLALTDRLYAVRVTAAIAVLSRGMTPASQPEE